MDAPERIFIWLESGETDTGYWTAEATGGMPYVRADLLTAAIARAEAAEAQSERNAAIALAAIQRATLADDWRDHDKVRAEAAEAELAVQIELRMNAEEATMRVGAQLRLALRDQDAAEAAAKTAWEDALREAAGYVSRAIDALTSGQFDASDPRIEALAEYADAFLALIEKEPK